MGETEDIIIHPSKAKRERNVPLHGLLLVTPAEYAFGQKLLIDGGGEKRFIYGSSLAVSSASEIFISGPAVGAPVAAMVMEKLIALGAEKLIMFGWCGTIDTELQVGDVVIGGNPLSGEGTSKYYMTPNSPLPSSSLIGGLAESLDDAGISFAKKNFWSTDAPYREDRNYLKGLYRSEGVSCVDMEYSALCAVAEFRNVEFASLFLVSDELYQQKWVPGYTRKAFREKSMSLVKLLTEFRNY